MNTPLLSSRCAGCPINRRQFFQNGALALGTFSLMPASSLLSAAVLDQKVRVRIIYSLHAEKQDRPDWPNKGFDFNPAMNRITNELRKRCRDIEFVVSTATGEEQAKGLVETDKASGDIDGYLVYQMNCWNRVVQTAASTGKPVLYADFQYGGSGGFLVYNAGFLRTGASNVGFVASSKIKEVAEAANCFKTVKKSGDIDGYLVYQMNCWNRVVQTAASTGKPVLYADFQYGGSGGFLVYNAGFLRTGASNVGFVASSKIKEVAEAANCFKTVKKSGRALDFAEAVAEVRMKSTPRAHRLAGKKDPVKCLSPGECLAALKEKKILAIRDQNAGSGGEIAGINVQQLPFAELNEAWKNADKEETRAVADRWEKTAAKVEGVSRETLETSAAMYLAEKALLKKHGAVGITINCLGGFYGGHIHAYPCLGFHQLCNEGLIGGCECDVRSAATMVIGTVLTQGRPGYISDPVIDTSKRQIIYAHCVAANKAFGPEGKENPFEILTHSEDRQGASVRSLLPTGYMTTTLEFEQSRKEILFHRGLAVENDPDDRACRTKLCAEPVGDIEKLFREWDQWSWHRVTFYGDLKEPVYALADALGWKVVEEA